MSISNRNDNLVGRPPPIFAVRHSVNRAITIWGTKLLMALALVVVVVGLARFASTPRSDQELHNSNGAGGGDVVRREVLHLWFPEAMTWLAKHQSRSALMQNHEELRQVLELLNLEDFWFALEIRDHHADGGFADIIFIRHPYFQDQYFAELMDVLATVAGNPPFYSDEFRGDFTTASVDLIPAEAGNKSPGEFIAEQLGRSSALDDPRHAP